MALPNSIEVLTLFVDHISETKAFYSTIFEPTVVYQDEGSCVLKFDGAMVNLLQASSAPPLVQPAAVAPGGSGVRMLLTIKVDDVDAVCAELREGGVTLLNGPTNQPWGRRIAAFADPSGHVWEVAQVLN
jgi:uncharacterized glyoxalase superfamily protein PhnB